MAAGQPADEAGDDAPRWRDAVLIGLGATVLATLGSWHVALWSDEAATASAARRSWSELVDLLGNVDAVHGVYYALMHLWVGLAGDSAFALRLPSALAVGAAATGTYVLAGRLAGRRMALLAGALVMVLPRVTWAGIEARPFALALALAVWATVALHATWHDRRRWPALAYGALVAAGVAVNVYVGLVVGAHAVTAALVRPEGRTLLRSGVAAITGVAAAAPLVLIASGQSDQLGDSTMDPVTLARNVVVNQWFLGETPTPVSGPASGAPPSGGLTAWQLAGPLLALVVLALAVWGAGLAGRRGRLDPAPVTAWAAPWLVVPTLGTVGYALVSGSGYAPRYLTVAAPALALLAASGIAALRGGRAWVALAVVVILAAPVYASQRRADAKNGSDWDVVAALVAERSDPGDGVHFPVRVEAVGAPERSLRAVALAYPAQFADLTDVTLVASPGASASLWGRSRPLADAAGTLARTETVWVVVRADLPAAALDADTTVLRESGFTSTVVHTTARTTILELRRSAFP